MDYNLDSGKFDFVDFDGQQARYRLGHSCNTTNLDLREQGLNLLKVMDLSHDPFLKAFKRSCVRYARIGLRIDSRLVLSRLGIFTPKSSIVLLRHLLSATSAGDPPFACSVTKL
jgi:hypothetical protein